jgi:trans-2,3-dihydro-3-hydroxyanthranilate isomerase
MSAALRFCLVDAFAERPFCGNVAGVVLNADALSAGQMQQIASEIHASETAFLSGTADPHGPLRIRWFTPTVEVGFCGHATLASAQALHEAGRYRPDSGLIVQSAAGELRLRAEAPSESPTSLIWWLDMPDPGLRPDDIDRARACEVLKISTDDLDSRLPVMRSRDDDVIVIVRDWRTLMDMQPDFAGLARWCATHGIRGLCVATTATRAPGIHVHSRFFAPAAGINEDPVTGSVHGPLTAYLVANQLVSSSGGRTTLLCAQGRPTDRNGLVRAVVESTPEGYRARIGGQCFTTLTGELRAPE